MCAGFLVYISITVLYFYKLWTFLRGVYPALAYAFGTSSSSASIPVTLKVVQSRLGVSPVVSAFVIPLGATINMDGTAIMQELQLYL